MQEKREQPEPWWYRDRAKRDKKRKQNLAQTQTVIFFWESYSDLMIDHEGGGIFARDLPIHEGLIEKLEARRLQQDRAPLAPMSARWIPNKSGWSGAPFAVGVPIAQGDEGHQRSVREGYELALALKRELPAWTICYASIFTEYLDPAGNFCPEVLLDGSRGLCPISGWRGLRMHPNFTASITTEKLKMRLTSPRYMLSQSNVEKYARSPPPWWHSNITDEAIASIELIQARKVVTLYCEYSTDNLLDFDNEEIFAEYLPIDAALISRIRKWRQQLNDLARERELADCPLNWKPFVEEGYQIAVALKAQLPDWTVSYADESTTYVAPGSYFCPEILPDGSLGPCRVEAWKGIRATERVNTFIG